MGEKDLQIEELEQEIEEIRRSLPAHSIPAAMLLRLEELEERRDELLKKVRDAPD